MKRLGLLVAALVMIVAMSITALAGEWGSQNGRWYYKGDNGKYYTNCKREIDGKTYAFDYDGWMITGFTDEFLNPISGTDYNAAFLSAYYFEPDGAMHKGWLKVARDGAPSEYDNYNELWFYYADNGRKVANTNEGDFKTTIIDGVKYAFDRNGVMMEGWGTSSTNKTVYVEGGQLAVGWKQMVPPSWMNSTDNAAGTQRWFYFKSNGEAVKDCCKKIGSAYYLFDTNGILKTGLYKINDGESISEAKYSSFSSVAKSTEADWANIIASNSTGKNYYYFTANGMQKGTQTIDFDGDKRTMNFASNGKGVNGVKSGKLYVNGGLVVANETKFAPAYDNAGGKHLVGTSGNVIGKGKVVTDYDYYWAVDKGGNIGQFNFDQKTIANAWAKEDNGGDYGTFTYLN